MSGNRSYFISGGNRGIGLALVKNISSIGPNFKVIATARNPESAKELQEWIQTHPNVHVIKYDAAVQDVSHISKEVEKISPEGLDAFFANSGIENGRYPVLEEKAGIWTEHYNVNVLGPILLTQALYPFLEKKQTRKIIYVSTILASMGGFPELSGSAYGQSKAALNYTAKLLSFELRDKNFIVVPIHPGLVSTDMGNGWLDRFALKAPEAAAQFRQNTITVDESAAHIVELAKNLTPEQSGKFLSYDGSEIAY